MAPKAEKKTSDVAEGWHQSFLHSLQYFVLTNRP